MEEKRHGKGHRWSQEEVNNLKVLWDAGYPVRDIARLLGVTRQGLARSLHRFRKAGVELSPRKKGRLSGGAVRPWKHGEVILVVSMRRSRRTLQEIADALGRTECAVQALVAKLRSEGVDVGKFGSGGKRQWSAEKL